MTGDESRQRMFTEADLATALAEHVSWHPSSFTLGGEKFSPPFAEDVPGYEDRDDLVLLKRESDGKVFEVDIDVTMRPLPPAPEEPS